MFYRLKPSGEITWNGLFLSRNDELPTQGFDLDQLEWAPVEEPYDLSQVIAIALRHGIKTGSGIAFESHFLSAVKQPAKLRQAFADTEQASAHPDIKATDRFMESMAPGWIEHGKRLDESVKQSSDKSIRDAEIKAQEILTAPQDPGLVDWWQKLGGLVV